MVGRKRLVGQFVALLRKKWILLKRKWPTSLLEAFIPLLLILVAIIIIPKLTDKSEHSKLEDASSQNNSASQTPANESGPQPSLLISLEKYASPISYYYSLDSDLETHIKAILGSSSQKFSDDNPTNFKN